MTSTVNSPGLRDGAERVAQYEAEMEDYPDEAGAILLELADTLRRAGLSSAAVEVLERAIAAGGEDGEYARASLAEVWFDLGRPERARAVLDELRRVGSGPGPRQLTAELLAERGDPVAALRWYNLAAVDIDFARPNLLDLVVLRGRRAVRRQLGLPPDAIDEAADELEANLPALAPTAPPLRSPEQALAENATSAGTEVRMMVLQREERLAAIAEFGSCFGEAPFDFVAANAELEASLREMSRRGTARVDLVLATAATMRAFFDAHGGDPTDDDLRSRYLHRRWTDGATVSWPPPRNGPCWCGSERKYKKCCR